MHKCWIYLYLIYVQNSNMGKNNTIMGTMKLIFPLWYIIKFTQTHTYYKILELNPLPSTSEASIIEIKASLSIFCTQYLNWGSLDICTIQYITFLSLPVFSLLNRVLIFTLISPFLFILTMFNATIFSPNFPHYTLW